MEPTDPYRYRAFERLLTKPDPPDLPQRGHVLHCTGDPDRRISRLPLIQMVWRQQWWLDNYGEEALPEQRHRRSR
jgi:hypothetical protein